MSANAGFFDWQAWPKVKCGITRAITAEDLHPIDAAGANDIATAARMATPKSFLQKEIFKSHAVFAAIAPCTSTKWSGIWTGS